MITVSPHRKRRANKGRPDTAVLVTSNYHRVGGTLVWDNAVYRDSSAGQVKAVDALIDESTFHRNRFNADHRLSLVAPNVSQVRSLLRHIRFMMPKAEMKEVIGPHGMICVKVVSRGADVLRIINNSKSDRLFQVEEGFINR